jgi:outer membrane immunogenic protein
MKIDLLTSVAVVSLAVATPALAAPPSAQIYNWTGFYAGGNAGYSWGLAKTNVTFADLGEGTPTSSSSTTSLNGFIGGMQAGYNWQHSNWIYGIEADFQGSGERGSAAFNSFYSSDGEGFTLNQTRDSKIQWFGTVRGRIGWLVDSKTMFYGTGGLAYGKVSVSGTVSDPENTGNVFGYGSSRVNVGFAVGGGIEGAFRDSKQWTWKLEYLYMDLGSLSGTSIEQIAGNPYSWNTKFTDHILRAGFNYRIP